MAACWCLYRGKVLRLCMNFWVSLGSLQAGCASYLTILIRNCKLSLTLTDFICVILALVENIYELKSQNLDTQLHFSGIGAKELFGYVLYLNSIFKLKQSSGYFPRHLTALTLLIFQVKKRIVCLIGHLRSWKFFS